MDKESILEMVRDSLYGYKYVLDRKGNYIETVYEDIKYKLKDKNEITNGKQKD